MEPRFDVRRRNDGLGLVLRCAIAFAFVCFGFLSQAWALELTDAEQKHLANLGRLTMCVDPSWMPYEKIDEHGAHIGIAADFMALASAKLGVPIELVPTTSWQESLDFAQSHKCDILSLLNKTDERAAYLNFTDPYIDAAVVLVARDEVLYLNGFEDLANHTLGVIEGYVYESYIRQNYPEVRLVYVDNLQDALLRVSKGEIFAAVDSLFIVSHHMQKLGLSNLKIAGQTDFTHALRVGVRDDDLLMLTAMQKAMDDIGPDERNEIMRKWFSFRFELGTDYSRVWQVVIVALLGFAFVIYRYQVQKRFNRQLQEKNRDLERLSEIDRLTGVFNRMKLDDVLEAEFERSRRYQRSLSVVMFDLDRFKQVNDTFGHQEGDAVLVACAQAVRDNIRQHDVFGRWGGEEFLILCPETTVDGAEQLAEHLRKAFEGMYVGEVGRFTASFGVAELSNTDDIRRLVRHVDEALYAAKEAGRNTVRVHTAALDQQPS
ncbi:diguanylate cyclase [Magnetovibrio sp. PR-2]|uniref:diguanylate cyclase n=1 Tax=Magnetovibrio sp. PR-2 TaxID=3120356 RepID=UPI002FCE33DE